MKRFIIGISCAAALLLLGMAAPSSRAQQILPPQFGKWALGSCAAAQDKAVVAETPVSKESKQKTVDVGIYCNGNAAVKATVHEFADSTGAYEFYTSELGAGTRETQ